MNLLLRKGVCPGGPALLKAASSAAQASLQTGNPSLAAHATLYQAQNSLSSDQMNGLNTRYAACRGNTTGGKPCG